MDDQIAPDDQIDDQIPRRDQNVKIRLSIRSRPEYLVVCFKLTSVRNFYSPWYLPKWQQLHSKSILLKLNYYYSWKSC